MNIRTIAASLAIFSCAVFAMAAETSTFDLIANGKKTATASYTLDNSKNGAKVHSSIDYVATNLPSRVIDYKVGPDGLLISGTISTSQNRTIIFYSPSKAHDSIQMALTVNSENKGISTYPMAKPDFLLVYPDDAAVWQVLLDLAKAHPHQDRVYTLLALSSKDTSSRIQPVRIEAPVAATGKLNGKTIPLQHYILTFNGSKGHLYTTDKGRLMQADIPLFGVSHVRTAFELDR